MNTPSIKAIRIAKFIARAGLCSRREAERRIEEGRVTLNGTLLTSPATTVTDKDTILVDNKALHPPDSTRLLLFHKPKNTLVTQRDPQGRKTIFDILPQNLRHSVAIGRLDYNSEGLLLLTNNGHLARYLELPSTGWIRRYRVRAYGNIDETKIHRLRNGITIDGISYAPAEILIDKIQGSNSWLSIAIKEGKNREIRKMLAYADLEVNRLIRVSFGAFHLGKLSKCEIRSVPQKQLLEQFPNHLLLQ